ncbi:MAG: hypothetical protein OEY93_06090 [Anaerolineae bacterium]|nr:hypothetical protein [Anaerolineae bacterium]
MKNKFRTLLILFFIFAAAAGSKYSFNKYRSLAYGQDTAFYLEFIARSADADLPDRYSYIPSIGINFLGFTGSDGKLGIHKTLHLELVKYVFSFIYMLSGGKILAVLAFNAVLFFLPVFYLALVHPFDNVFKSFCALAFSFLYLVYPSSLLALTFDLRPRNLIAPVMLLSLISIHFKRPLWEKLLLFGALFFIREEFILFAIPLMVYDYLTTRDKKHLLSFVRIWLLGILLVGIFINWAGYEYIPESNQILKVFQYPQMRTLFTAGILVFPVVLFYVLKKQALDKIPSWVTAVVVIGFLNAPIFPELYFIIEKGLPFSGFDTPLEYLLNMLVISPQPMIFVFTSLLLLFVIFPNSIEKVIPKTIYLLFCFCAVFYVSRLNYQHSYDIYEKFGRPSKINLFPQQADDIFSLRANTSQLDTYILDDINTHQAFYDYGNSYVFHNLPWYLEPEDVSGRAGLSLLEALLLEKIEYIVIQKSNREVIDAAFEKLNITPLETLESERFIVYTIK